MSTELQGASDHATAEYLTALPVSVQEQLVRIVRVAAGMSVAEKTMARGLLAGAALYLATESADDDADELSAAEMMTACAQIVDMVDTYSRHEGAVI